jgi:hypothetical protein
MELEPTNPASRLAHVEAHDPSDPFGTVEEREQPLGEHSGDAGHCDRPGEHVHRLIG